MAANTTFCRSPLLLLLIIGVCSFLFLLHVLGRKEKMMKSPSVVGIKGKLPPGPRGLPILGSVPMLGHLPHITLHQWAKKYGPIMYLRLGQIPTVVVSSPHTAQQFLKTHDLVFANRACTEYGRLINYSFKGLSFCQYGSYWRNVRKLCTLELLSNLKVESLRPMRREELSLLIELIKDAAKARAVVDLTTKVASLSRDTTCRMVFGKKYNEETLGEGGFKAVAEDLMDLAAAFNVSEYIPCTRELDLQGVGRRMIANAKVLDEFFDKVVEERLAAVAGEEKKHRDFVDYMLDFLESGDCEFLFDRTNIKAILSDMLIASIDTTPTVVVWTLSELMKHPRVMEKAQQELENFVGTDRMVDESDLAKLDYLDMVVKESMRLHPPVPFLLPHESREDCMVDGFYIPKGSRLIVNTWAIGRDPEAWPNSEEFKPERFIGTDIDVRGHDFQLIPFGSGRRGCPAMQMGITMVRLGVAQLIHCFNWELPNGMGPADLDMAEKFSLVMPRANHLLAIPTYRLLED
ncbi:hypothetical protein MRB53_015986 [Persea americana]|uniref:Uncharacterized protein n=1 Tax=Persea americana TaxID=3435 RepID=A0ACC2M0U2_PERAE|nr:hypothetical protein MRB53_015986 [Persea americana]